MKSIELHREAVALLEAIEDLERQYKDQEASYLNLKNLITDTGKAQMLLEMTENRKEVTQLANVYNSLMKRFQFAA